MAVFWQNFSAFGPWVFLVDNINFRIEEALKYCQRFLDCLHIQEGMGWEYILSFLNVLQCFVKFSNFQMRKYLKELPCQSVSQPVTLSQRWNLSSQKCLGTTTDLEFETQVKLTKLRQGKVPRMVTQKPKSTIRKCTTDLEFCTQTSLTKLRPGAQVKPAMDGPSPSPSPSKICKKELYYRLGIWHLD